MNKKHFLLIGVLALLVIIYVVNEVSFKSSMQTFNPDILKIDSASINEVTIIPAKGDTIVFEKNGEDWKLRSGTLITVASKASVENMLKELSSLKIDRLASNTESDLQEYQLSDSLCSYIVVRDALKKEIARLKIGKISFKPLSGRGVYGMQNSVEGITYFKIDDSDNIYAAVSFIGMMTTMPVDQWRNNFVIQCDAEKVMRIEVKSPEENFVLAKDGNEWKINDIIADTNAVQQYIGQLSFQHLNQYENSQTNMGEEIYKLRIEQENASPIIVSCYAINDSTLHIRSSQNPELFRTGVTEPFITTCFKKRIDFIAK